MAEEATQATAEVPYDFDPAAFGLPTSFGNPQTNARKTAPPPPRGRGRGRGRGEQRPAKRGRFEGQAARSEPAEAKVENASPFARYYKSAFADPNPWKHLS